MIDLLVVALAAAVAWAIAAGTCRVSRWVTARLWPCDTVVPTNRVPKERNTP